ncbi:MAG TPA: hypothetical protein VGN80_09445 [Devosiaceae bacterium]|jgi:hypothetical protein|nr:hypothetical protein [Devosiaceae bacterium]
MNARFAPILIASLLGTTAFVPATVAQDTAAASCDNLLLLIEDNRDRLQEAWIAEATPVAQAGDEANCLVYYEDAATALNVEGREMTAEETEAAARIVVTQPDPSVTVQQEAPEVSVTQPQPEVVVNQGEPQIIVRQAPPTVRVQIPQPTITIDQPQPEIIVRMPNPDVQVSTPQPEVEVRQQEPTVRVDQPEPEVQVQQEETDTDAEVQVQQEQVTVRQQPAEGQARVRVERAEPNVTFEPAEPNIEFESGGEPQVQFTQSGEPVVRFEDMEADEQSQQRSQAQPTEGQQSAGQRDVMALIIVEGQAEEAGNPQPYASTDVIGQQLVNINGDNLGTVERLVMVDNQYYVVLGEDSPLSDGQGGVVLPLEHISFIGGQLVMRGMTEAQLTELQNFDGSGAQDVTPEQQVEIGTR